MEKKVLLSIINISSLVIFIFFGIIGLVGMTRVFYMSDIYENSLIKLIVHTSFFIMSAFGLIIQLLIYNLKAMKK